MHGQQNVKKKNTGLVTCLGWQVQYEILQCLLLVYFPIILVRTSWHPTPPTTS